MELDIKIVGIHGEKEANAKSAILPRIRELAGLCGVDEAQMGRFVVADETNYAAAVQEISPTELCTDGNGLLGVGKTVVTSDEADSITNHIVIRVEMVGAMMEAADTRMPLEDWPVEGQTGAYVIAHEFGHCRDNSSRPGALELPPLATQTFTISEFGRYYGHIAISEYAASYFSSSLVTPRLFSDFLIQYANSVSDLAQKAHRRRRAYTGTHQLFDLACAAASAYWFGIVQAVKLFGMRKNNPTLQALPINWSEWFAADTERVLKCLEENLSETWDGYPHISDPFIKRCQAAWAQIALAEGFKFLPNPAPSEQEGDAVFFDTTD